MAEDIGFSRLPRGSKILWERVADGRTVSLGFFFATGARFDPTGLAGTAHFVEHMVFKGTQRYSASAMARLVDRVGGDLNAWTDREEMGFTCSVPAEHWRIALEALCEICLFPTFPEDEVEREREVIRNEILASLEDPEDLSYEEYLAKVSPGRWSDPVAGTEESLAAITRKDLVSWWGQWFRPELLTVIVAGGAPMNQVEGALEQILSSVPQTSVPADSQTREVFLPRPGFWRRRSGFQMAQVICGSTLGKPRSLREAMIWQALSLLWAENMSSRLFQTLREELGLCYAITSQILDTENTWVLQTFVSCAPENSQAVLSALHQETLRLELSPPTDDEWSAAWAALHGGLLLACERTEARVGRLWQIFRLFGLVQGLDQALELLSALPEVEEKTDALSRMTKGTRSCLVWGRIPAGLTYG